jgi:membrane fusion protein (multidrug efflux system)
LGVLQAEIALVKHEISKTEISAPFNGQLGLRYVSPGGYISSQTLVTRIIQNDPVKVEFTVPEKHFSWLNVGTIVAFRVEGIDSLFHATVYAIESRIDPSTRSASVRARCGNAGGLLVPGAYAKVEVILETIPDALILPSEALIPDIRGEKVFVCREGLARQVYVSTGIRTEKAVQVTSGINPGDTVITTGLLLLRENMKVKALVGPVRGS